MKIPSSMPVTTTKGSRIAGAVSDYSQVIISGDVLVITGRDWLCSFTAHRHPAVSLKMILRRSGSKKGPGQVRNTYTTIFYPKLTTLYPCVNKS